MKRNRRRSQRRETRKTKPQGAGVQTRSLESNRTDEVSSNVISSKLNDGWQVCGCSEEVLILVDYAFFSTSVDSYFASENVNIVRGSQQQVMSICLPGTAGLKLQSIWLG